jgi:hypothetical protein
MYFSRLVLKGQRNRGSQTAIPNVTGRTNRVATGCTSAKERL